MDDSGRELRAYIAEAEEALAEFTQTGGRVTAAQKVERVLRNHLRVLYTLQQTEERQRCGITKCDRRT